MCKNEQLEHLALKYPEFRRLLEGGVLPEVIDAEIEASEKERKENKVMMDFFKVRNNLIGFQDGMIEALQQTTLIEKINVSDDNGNDYYRIKSVENMVFMSVEDDYGVLIPEIIEWNGNSHNFVEVLSKIRWNIYSGNRVCATSIANLPVHRAMWSLALYGDMTIKMNGQWHVHHKSYRWWNDLSATVVVCKHRHHDFHKGNGGSHQGGIYFKTVDEFTSFIKKINATKPIVKNMKM